MQRNGGKKQNKKDQRFLQENERYQGNISCKDGLDKGQEWYGSDRVLEELQMEVCNIVQEAVIKTIPNKKKCKKAKRLSEEALEIAEKR